MQATFAEVKRTHLVSGLENRNKVCAMNAVYHDFRTLHLVAIVLSLSSISNSSLTIPCVVISSVKSSYAPGFFLLINRTDFLSRSSRGTHDRKFPTTPEVSQMVFSVL